MCLSKELEYQLWMVKWKDNTPGKVKTRSGKMSKLAEIPKENYKEIYKIEKR